MSLFVSKLWVDPWFYFCWVLLVLFSVCVHECAHAFVAMKRGDHTAVDEGHLTLNPWVQLGPVSMVLLCIFGIAWGSVPVNPRNHRKPHDAALVAVAGPAANLLLSFLFAGLSVLLHSQVEFSRFFLYGCSANAMLFLLNMLPVPMFDGWTVFSFFFPSLEKVDSDRAQTISFFAIFLLFITPLGDLLWLGSNVLTQQFCRFFFSFQQGLG